MFGKIIEQLVESIPFLVKLLPYEMVDIQFEVVPYAFNTKGFVVDCDTNIIECGNPLNDVKGEFVWKLKTTITNVSKDDIFLERFQIIYPQNDIYVEGYDYSRKYLKKGDSLSFIIRIHHETIIKVGEIKKLMHIFPFCLDKIKIQVDWSYSWVCLRPRRTIITCLTKDEQYYLK